MNTREKTTLIVTFGALVYFDNIWVWGIAFVFLWFRVHGYSFTK